MADLKLEVLLSALDKASGPLKNISNASKATARGLKDTQAQLRALDQQSRQVSGLSAQQEKLRALDRQMATTRAQAARLTEQMGTAQGRDASKYGRQLEQANSALGRMDRSAEKLRGQIRQTEAALHAAGGDTSNLAQAQSGLSSSTAAATAQLAAQRDALEKLVSQQAAAQDATNNYDAAMQRAQELREAGKNALGLGLAGAATLGLAVAAYGEQEDAVTRLRMAMMRIGAEVPPEFQKVADLAEHLGDQLPGNTADFDAMMTMLMRQGQAAQTILDGTGESAAHLGVLLKMAPEGAAEFAAQLQDATSTAAKDMLGLADVIQRAYHVGIDPSNMLSAFSNAAAGLAMIKQQGLEGARAMAPLIAMLDQASLKGEAAGTALTSIFSKAFATQGKKAQQAQKAAGIKLEFVDQKGEFKGLDNMFSQLEKLKPLSTAARISVMEAIWGTETGVRSALNTMINKGAAGYAEMRANIEGQASEGERIAALLQTQTQMWDAATGAFTNLQASVGELLSPLVKQLITWFNDASVAVKAWVKANPELAGTLTKLAAAASVLLMAVGSLLIVFASLKVLLASARLGFALLGLGPVAAAVGAAAGTFALIAAAVVAAAAVIYLYWGPISNFFRGVWAGLSAGLAPLAGIFATTWGAINAVLQPVLSVLRWIWEKITALIPATNSAGSAGYQMGQLFGAGAAQIIVKIAEVVAAAIQLPFQILAAVGQAAGQFAAMGVQMIDGLWSGIRSRAAAMLDYMTGLAHQISAAFQSAMRMFSPSRVFAAHGQNLVLGLVQGIHATTPAALAQIGTLSRALTLTAAGLAIPPLTAAAPLATGGGHQVHYGGDQISITITAAPGTDAQGLAQHIARALREHEHQKTVRRRAALRDLD